MTFSDRVQAGKLLVKALEKYKSKDAVIYGLPRGGVVVATEIAKALKKPLDLLIIRKIGHPYNTEYALCATSINGHLVCDEAELAQVDPKWFQEELERQKTRAKEQYGLYLAGKKPILAKGKIAIIVDDGVATGLTMKAAIKEIRYQNPRQVIVAVPVIPVEVAQEIQPEVDNLVALEIPEKFMGSVGAYYEHFPQVSDKEVIHILNL